MLPRAQPLEALLVPNEQNQRFALILRGLVHASCVHLRRTRCGQPRRAMRRWNTLRYPSGRALLAIARERIDYVERRIADAATDCSAQHQMRRVRQQRRRVNAQLRPHIGVPPRQGFKRCDLVLVQLVILVPAYKDFEHDATVDIEKLDRAAFESHERPPHEGDSGTAIGLHVPADWSFAAEIEVTARRGSARHRPYAFQDDVRRMDEKDRHHAAPHRSRAARHRP